MQPQSDAQLLREYAEHGAETAFAEIVARHTNLVYSAAVQQVDSPDIAAEVAQSAFIGLACGARSLSRKLAESASLAGWLCRSARNISLNLRRDEFRRHSRERQAMENLDSIPDATSDWEHLRPVLDEAMSELSERDYDALLMRFFKNQDLRSVGLALGVSDDAAQKRVSRALDKLRDLLSRRGIRTSAAPLSIILSANAVQAAPAGLIVTISTAAALAGTTIATTATATAAKAIAMTTLQKSIITVTFAAAVTTGIYEARQVSRLRDQNQTLRQQQTPREEHIEQLSRERDDATSKFAALRDENERLNRNTSELLRLRSEVASLRARLRGASDESAIEQPATNATSLGQILKILWDNDPTAAGDHRRIQAAEQLRNLGPQAIEGLSAFRELLHSGNQETSYAGARALAFTSEASPEAFQELSNALSDPDAPVRDAATHGVGLLFAYQFKNVDADSTLPRLVQNLGDVDQTVRADTATAIREYVERQKQMGKSGEPELVIPALMRNLEDDYQYARLDAANALQEYGAAAKAAIPQMRKLLQDPDPQVQSAAKNALEHLVPGGENSSTRKPD